MSGRLRATPSNPTAGAKLYVASLLPRRFAPRQADCIVFAKINFGGGEPLLNWGVIEKAISYCLGHYNGKFDFKFSINTNASLINDEVAEKMKFFGIKIATSLDGLEIGNDKVRIMRGGGKTFNSILDGFNILRKVKYPIGGVAVTINDKNFYDLDKKLIDWAFDHEMSDVRIDIDVLGLVNIPIEEVVEKLISLRNYASKRGIEIYGFWSRPVENMNFSILDKHIAFCGATRGNSLCISPLGNIYGCGYSSIEFGSIYEGLKKFYASDGEYSKFVLNHIAGSIEECFGCAIEGQCMGGCNITREFAAKNSNSGLQKMCELYRVMTPKLILE